MKEGGDGREEGGANSSSVRVRNYNGAIHHERPPIRHADPRVQPVFECNPSDLRTYEILRTSQLTRVIITGDGCLLFSPSTLRFRKEKTRGTRFFREIHPLSSSVIFISRPVINRPPH